MFMRWVKLRALTLSKLVTLSRFYFQNITLSPLILTYNLITIIL